MPHMKIPGTARKYFLTVKSSDETKLDYAGFCHRYVLPFVRSTHPYDWLVTSVIDDEAGVCIYNCCFYFMNDIPMDAEYFPNRENEGILCEFKRLYVGAQIFRGGVQIA